MRFDLAHKHWKEPHASRANHRRDLDILMMLYISWHHRLSFADDLQTRAKATAGWRKADINSFEQRRNGGGLSFAVTFLLRLCTVTSGPNTYFKARSDIRTLTSMIREQRP